VTCEPYCASRRPFLIAALALLFSRSVAAQTVPPPFKVIAIAEAGGIHKPFVNAAKVWLQKEAQTYNFTVDYIEDTKLINDSFLAQYKLFIQLNYPPYNWTPTATSAFEQAIERGTIGWIGFHHATLLGEFDGFSMLPWFSRFMGDITFTQYIPTFVTGTVLVEDRVHLAMKGLPRSFKIENEEWYTWNRSPRTNVHVLASVDENTYTPETAIKMGDHPVVWTNEHVKARNIYIFMGHHPELFQDSNFTTLFHNCIIWAAGR
jgi:type 1 glutamine amidotransferase